MAAANRLCNFSKYLKGKNRWGYEIFMNYFPVNSLTKLKETEANFPFACMIEIIYREFSAAEGKRWIGEGEKNIVTDCKLLTIDFPLDEKLFKRKKARKWEKL